jgi:hypothetical protein
MKKLKKIKLTNEFKIKKNKNQENKDQILKKNQNYGS